MQNIALSINVYRLCLIEYRLHSTSDNTTIERNYSALHYYVALPMPDVLRFYKQKAKESRNGRLLAESGIAIPQSIPPDIPHHEEMAREKERLLWLSLDWP
jgi:hypothetical protein